MRICLGVGRPLPDVIQLHSACMAALSSHAPQPCLVMHGSLVLSCAAALSRHARVQVVRVLVTWPSARIHGLGSRDAGTRDQGPGTQDQGPGNNETRGQSPRTRTKAQIFQIKEFFLITEFSPFPWRWNFLGPCGPSHNLVVGTNLGNLGKASNLGNAWTFRMHGSFV